MQKQCSIAFRIYAIVCLVDMTKCGAHTCKSTLYCTFWHLSLKFHVQSGKLYVGFPIVVVVARGSHPDVLAHMITCVRRLLPALPSLVLLAAALATTIIIVIHICDMAVSHIWPCPWNIANFLFLNLCLSSVP